MANLLHPPRQHQKFFKVLKSEREAFLMIPDEFQKRFLSPLPRHVTIRAGDGKLWIIAVLAYRGVGYFTAGWRTFRKEYMLKKGDLVIFDFNREAHFDVVIFTKNSLEKHFPTIARNAGEDPLHERSKRTRVNIIEGESSSLVQTYDLEAEDQIESTLSALSPESVDTDSGIIEYIESSEYHPMDDQERVSIFGAHVPNCYIVIFSNALAPNYELNIPVDFSRSEFEAGLTTITLKRIGHGQWTIICSMQGNQATVIHGWKKFAIENDIGLYDQCSFERNLLLPATWNVTVFKNK